MSITDCLSLQLINVYKTYYSSFHAHKNNKRPFLYTNYIFVSTLYCFFQLKILCFHFSTFVGSHKKFKVPLLTDKCLCQARSLSIIRYMCVWVPICIFVSMIIQFDFRTVLMVFFPFSYYFIAILYIYNVQVKNSLSFKSIWWYEKERNKCKRTE